MRQVAENIKYMQSSICTHRAVYSYIIIHMIISAFGVFVNTFRLPDDIPWKGVKRCGRNKRQVAAPIEATSVAPVQVA